MKKNVKPFPLPKVDFAFAWLFADPRNCHLLQALLEAILDLPIGSVKVLSYEDRHLKRRHESDKMGILDVLVTLRDGTKVNVEMQLFYHGYILERITFYNGRLVSNQLEAGQDYSELKRAISILIVDKNVIPHDEAYHHKFQLYDAQHQVKLTDLIEIHTLELQKLPLESDLSTKYQWMKFLKSENEDELRSIARGDIHMEDALYELEKLKKDSQAMDDYIRRHMAIQEDKARFDTATKMGFEEGLRSGRQQGLDEGRQEGRQEGHQEGHAQGFKEGMELVKQQAYAQMSRMILLLLQNGTSEAEITQSLDLDAETIQRLLDDGIFKSRK